MRHSSKPANTVTSTQINEATSKLILAGLGAVSLVHKRGQQAIDTLIAEGESFSARTRRAVRAVNNDARKAASNVRKQVNGLVTPFKQRALKNVQQVEASISDGVGAVLGRFGVPSKGDVQDLLTRVSELNKEIRASTRKTVPRART